MSLLASDGRAVIVAMDHARGVRVLLTMLPPSILALLAQRYIVRGLTLGAVKG